MLLDFEVQRCTRRCAATDVALEPGDQCYSVLEIDGADIIRRDYCLAAWSKAPDTALGWWKARVPEPTAKKIKLAPNDVLLELFDQLSDRLEQADLRYVLALLLIRRRILRLEEESSVGSQVSGASSGETGCLTPATLPIGEIMHVYCLKRDTSYAVAVQMPTGTRIDEIQAQLSDLLVADAE
jgi:hypothetical protein